jgi:four helix bundle protein
MKNRNLIERTKTFAHDCVKIALLLPTNKLGLHIQGQLIKCSTSVAANYRAANLAQSRASFIAKLSIVLEETDEAAFWLEFLIEERLLTEEQANRVLKEAKELTAIFISSRKTANINK